MKMLKSIYLLVVLAACSLSAATAQEAVSPTVPPGGLNADSKEAAVAPTPIPGVSDSAPVEPSGNNTPATSQDAAQAPQSTPSESGALPEVPSPAEGELAPLVPEGEASVVEAKPGEISPAEKRRRAIRIREMRTELQDDPDLVFQKKQAAEAKTFEGNRVALRNYYNQLYAKMLVKEPTLQVELEEQLTINLDLLAQKKIRATPLVEEIRSSR